VNGGQRGGCQESQHATGLPQPVEALADCRLAAHDVRDAAAGKRHDEEADAHAVVSAAVYRLPEQPAGAHEEHERQDQRHPAESAVDHGVDSVREPAAKTPPGEGGDEDRQGQVEQGGPVTAVLGCEVADVLADPANSPAHQMADALPGPAGHPQQPGLPVFDGGKLARAGAAGRSGPAGFGRRGAAAACRCARFTAGGTFWRGGSTSGHICHGTPLRPRNRGFPGLRGCVQLWSAPPEPSVRLPGPPG
jgi:hypothetical protein